MAQQDAIEPHAALRNPAAPSFVRRPPRRYDVTPAFAPLSIAGRATFTETVRFYPVGYALPKLASEAGDYRFTLKLNTAAAKEPDIIDRAWRKEPTPLSFDLQLPWISEQHLGFRRGTIAMHAADWKPTAAAASSPGRAD